MCKPKKIIWGAGEYGKRFAYSLGRNNFDFFIDRDKNKEGSFLLGKKIISPNSMCEREWKESFFFIPFNFRDEIASLLNSKGLREKENYEVYGNKVYCRELDAIGELYRYEKELERLKKNGITSLVFGHTLHRYGYERLIHELSGDTVVISENICGEETAEAFGHPVVAAPAFADPYAVVRASKKQTPKDIPDMDGTRCTNGRPYLQEAMEQIKNTFEDANYVDCKFSIFLCYQYYQKTFQTLKVKHIIAFSSTQFQHRILMGICREQGTNVIFTHPGVLPGTFAFEINGEVGESPVTLHASKFNKLPITTEEISYAADIWSFLFRSKLNRKVQPIGKLPESIEKRINKDSPIVLFMGQNDVESYMVPYTDETGEYWSPIFESSTDAAIYLANLCEKNGWNFIYKPHPMYSQPEQVARLPANTIFIEFGNINDIIDRCDVAVTILSSSNYIALIRKKPVVMLGYNQIKGAGCCYEAYEEGLIEGAIREALEKGFTGEQQKNFQAHIARLVKYYLYDDMQPREIRYGKKAPTSFDDFYELDKLLKEGDSEHVL